MYTPSPIAKILFFWLNQKNIKTPKTLAFVQTHVGLF